MQNYWIQNADITASSVRDIFHDPGKARLHGNSAWMPSAQNEEQFLQIYFKGGTNVSAVAFQGHPNYEYWVTRYKLSFSLDGKTWEELSEVNWAFLYFVVGAESLRCFFYLFYLFCSPDDRK